MSWLYFCKKHYELWPLFTVVGIAMGGMTSFIFWSIFKKDVLWIRGKHSWDKRDLLRHPYCRKILHFNEEFDTLTEMDCIYKEMDKAERELHRRRKEDKC